LKFSPLSKPFTELGFGGRLGYQCLMSRVETAVLEALLNLEKTVRAMPTTHPKPDLRPYLAKVDQLTAELPKETDPILVHYLRNKSYEKARLWLLGRDKETRPDVSHRVD
jgi:hypothetical protein